LLAVAGITGTLIPGLLIAHEHYHAAGIVGALALVLGLGLVLRPLFVRGLSRLAKAVAFFGAFLGLLGAAGFLTFLLCFRVYQVPTGAMATGLPGYHETVTCPQCGYTFPVNVSQEVDPQREDRVPVTGCTCPNCRYPIDFKQDRPKSNLSVGVRILTARYLAEPALDEAQRYQVVVFQCPEHPPDRRPELFVMRLVGLPGETLAIYRGNLYRASGLGHEDPAADADNLWRREHMHADDERDRKHFQQGKFEILRKPPEVMLALRRIVYDNDFLAKDLAGVLARRWAAADKASGWATAPSQNGFRAAPKGKDVDWLRYHHLLRPGDWPGGKDRQARPQLITDFLAYNSYEPNVAGRDTGRNWVGDLMLDFELTVDRAEGEVWVELARGIDRFQARWDLPTGKCSLWRLQDGKPHQALAEKPTSVKGPGTYHIRFANFDERLTVWVDRDLPFGDGVSYSRAWQYDEGNGAFVNTGPGRRDLEPASIGSKGAAVKLDHLKLWRNTYYTLGTMTGCDARLPEPVLPDLVDEPFAPPDEKKRAKFVARVLGSWNT
jgi:signal peptidase I